MLRPGSLFRASTPERDRMIFRFDAEQEGAVGICNTSVSYRPQPMFPPVIPGAPQHALGSQPEGTGWCGADPGSSCRRPACGPSSRVCGMTGVGGVEEQVNSLARQYQPSYLGHGRIRAEPPRSRRVGLNDGRRAASAFRSVDGKKRLGHTQQHAPVPGADHGSGKSIVHTSPSGSKRRSTVAPGRLRSMSVLPKPS